MTFSNKLANPLGMKLLELWNHQPSAPARALMIS